MARGWLPLLARRPRLRQTHVVATRRIAWISAAWFWTLLALTSGIQDWIAMISHGHSVPRLLVYNLAVWEAWLLLSAGVSWLSRRSSNRT